ncbi:uncharacterized protein C14orf119 [Agrilus planipennis]|uniref:Uncharacterized protein C14orf119 n=1 Tax=Agrilus planipennis TaxID=224129 RepID=A0A7F5R494_AGRPL|nr:uncharacterized protein C14orf119 [Agrilus planipennis]
MTNLNFDSQFRYLIQWFNEWSELQKSDFLPILAEKYSKKIYINGIVNSISAVDCQDKPMSLFQCRVKLFKEWFTQWNPEQQDRFLKKIMEIDETFAEKLKSELENGVIEENHDSENVLED